MPDFGNRGFGPPDGRDPRDGNDGWGGQPSLDAVARSDRFVEALSLGQQVPIGDAADRALADLMGSWRDDIRWPSDADVMTEDEAASALESTLPAERGRPRRGLAVVSSVAAAMLAIGGFGAVVAGAGPGDSLYGLHTALFGEPQSARDDKVALAAQTEMAQVQQLIDQGNWEQAQEKLATVSTAVASVDNEQTKQDLVDQWNQLNVKVEQRDPEATVPPSAPPGPEVVVPSLLPSLTLPMPALEPPPTSTESAEPTPPSEEPSSQPQTPTSITVAPAPPTSVATTTTSAPPVTATGPPTSTSPTTSAPVVEAPAPGSVATSAPPTAVTTTVPPATVTTTTTTFAPAGQAPPSSVGVTSSAASTGSGSGAEPPALDESSGGASQSLPEPETREPVIVNTPPRSNSTPVTSTPAQGGFHLPFLGIG